MRKLWLYGLALILALTLVSQVMAQAVASITGSVADTSGAYITGASVTLENPSTGAVYKTKTNSQGVYTISNLPPGPGYKITIDANGFKSAVVTEMYLNVNTTRSQSVRLTVGGSAQTVEVSAAGQDVTLNTTDATVGNNYQVSIINELPVQIRDTPAALFSMQPGVTDSAVTGARTDQSNVTLDGLSVNDLATGQFGSVIANAPVDSVQEMNAVTASPNVSDGQGGGGQFAMVTRSGTNDFHGALFEYHRDTALEANEWFNNNAGVSRAALIRNQFGGKVGGPIKKDKLFFFFEYNGRRDNQGVQANRTVPLDSFRNQTISYIKKVDSNGATCLASSRQNTTPDCIGSIDATQVAALDPQGIGFNAGILSLISDRMPAVNDVTGGDGINSGNFRFNAPVILKENDYVGRLDYTLNSSMKLWARGSVVSERHGDATNYSAPIQFPGDPVTHQVEDSSYAWVVGHDWTIGANKTNKIIYGETRARLGFPDTWNPTGTTQLANFGGNGTGGAFLSSPYPSAVNAQRRIVPIPVVKDDFTWLKNNHTLQFGGQFKFIKTYSNVLLNYDQPSIGLGGNMSALNASLRPAGIRTAGTTASKTYDEAFALALGRYASITSEYNYNADGTTTPQGSGSIRQYRYYEFEGYVGDSWKVTPSLTLNYGVRYQWYSVPYETGGRESVQDTTFNDFFSARLAQSAAGLSGDSTVPFISYDLGGKANNGKGYYDPNYLNFAPRVSFAYNPTWSPKSVFRGGAGIVYDYTIVNAVQYQQDQYSYLFGSSNTTSYGVASAPVTSLQNDPRFTSISTIPATPVAPTITHPYTPWVSDGTPTGLANGQAFNETIDPKLKSPYSIVLNMGFEYSLPQNFILKLNYVGRLGRRLLGQADANQLIEFPDTVSGQNMSTAFANLTQAVRGGADTTNMTAQPWFENVVSPGWGVSNGYPNNTSLLADNFTTLVSNGDFADFIQSLASYGAINSNVGMGSQFSENTFYTNKGFSAYHGMLVTLHKNTSNGLQFDLNYTWSHSIDNVSVVANTPAIGGYGFICDVVRPRECRGNSDFDITQIITGNALYALPFGRGREFGGNLPRWADEVVGGWNVSALPSWHTGQAFSTVSSAFVAGYANNAPGILVGSASTVRPHAHKGTDGTVSMFSDPDKALTSFTGPVGFQIGRRNDLRAPNYVNFDMGLSKDFSLWREDTKLVFRTDAFNVFNHASFDTPSTTDITSGSFGQITGVQHSARVLQGALRFEF